MVDVNNTSRESQSHFLMFYLKGRLENFLYSSSCEFQIFAPVNRRL